MSVDFSVIFQLRTKKFWWMDVIFYFVISLLIAAVLCYLIFLVKNNFQREDIRKETQALQTVGTDQQKEYEKSVITYKKKINDFGGLLKNHEFASNVFAFMQTQTMPNIWFKQFALDEKGSTVQLSGESDDLDALSRQVAIFEKNKYVQSIGALNSSLGDSARIGFNINLVLDKNIFGYLSDMASILQPAPPPEQSPTQQGQTTPENNPPAQAGTTTNPSAGGQQPPPARSSEKLITSFHLLLSPEVIGLVDETNYTITLNVPRGTDVKNLTPSMVISPGATVSPAPNTPQDFTNPVTYTVVAQDGSAQNYKAEVLINALPQATTKSSQSGYIILITIVLVFVVAVIAGAFLFLRKRSNKQQMEASKISNT